MFTSEILVNAAMTGKITHAEAEEALDIATRVEREITCVVTGAVLDSRTAFGIFADDGTCFGVVSPGAVDHENVVKLLADRPQLSLRDSAGVWAKL